MSDTPANPDTVPSGEAGVATPTPAPLIPAQSITGATLDPVDGQPFFGEWEGVMMSRERYLTARREKARAELVARLQQPAQPDEESAEEDEQ